MPQDHASWTFFSNHGHVYFLLANNEEIVVRQMALKVGVTERTILGILSDLEESGYIKRKKVGRRNKYSLVPKKTLRHPLESNIYLKDITGLMKKSRTSKAKTR